MQYLQGSDGGEVEQETAGDVCETVVVKVPVTSMMVVVVMVVVVMVVVVMIGTKIVVGENIIGILVIGAMDTHTHTFTHFYTQTKEEHKKII